ncbi:MAG: hypothetical protein A2Z52_02865 [Candidatus Moranbacteria bacterium RBG_19FT_COMBO_42_6]|nr:MAG: hypothetical protein A2Z52_02865 [Candidatus Moranbacteria bacterium RBG_19FT_COMBO_42_6]
MKFIRPFFFGITAALGALFLELLIGMLIGSPEELTDIFFNQLTLLLILSVLIEEILKLTFVYRSQLELKNYLQNETETIKIGREFFLNSFLVGIGFSCMESFFIFFSLSSVQEVFDLKLAILGIFLIHTFTSSLMGYLPIKFSSYKFYVVPPVLLIAMLIHLLYNSLIIYSVQPFFILAYLLVLALVFIAMALSLRIKTQK